MDWQENQTRKEDIGRCFVITATDAEIKTFDRFLKAESVLLFKGLLKGSNGALEGSSQKFFI